MCYCRSLDKLNHYRSRVRPAARGGPVRWSGYLPSATIPKRGSSGANLAALTSFSGNREKSMSGSSVGDKQVNPGLVTIHNAVALLPINYALAKAYRCATQSVHDCAISNCVVCTYYIYNYGSE